MEALISRSNWNLEVLVSVGGKPEIPEKNPWSKARTNNKLNPHETVSTGIEPGSQRWEASAYPLHQPCSPTANIFPPQNTQTYLFYQFSEIFHEAISLFISDRYSSNYSIY